MRVLSLSSILIAALAVASMASAQEATAFDAAAALQQQRQIRSEVDAGSGRYGRLPADVKRELVKRQDGVFKALEGQGYDGLDESQRARLDADLAWIAAVPEQVAGERLICERVRSMGSNRVERVCRTAAQRQAERESVRNKAGVDRTLEQRNVCANDLCSSR